MTGDSGGVVSHGSCVTERDESGDSHVTEQSEEGGRLGNSFISQTQFR